MTLDKVNEHRDGVILFYKGTSVNELADKVQTMFMNDKYKLESGTKIEGIYGTGNAILRILFGAFVKRYKFQIKIYEEGENVKLEFSKAMSGFSGGAIGVSKLNKEIKKIIAKLKELN